MTLQEAIKHAREVSESECEECKKEHEQLAEWLEELERLRSVFGNTYDLDHSVWTAEWIWSSNEFNLPKGSKCGCNSKDATYGHKNNFCPKCGRAMNDVAWEMLERRFKKSKEKREMLE